MSILKGILHHWNKTTRNYDIIHPETESARVTDWNQGIVNTLASTALSGLVNTLTSDSLLATMIKKVLTATGVKYSMGQNGYICFGSLFGGLIIQWIKLDISNRSETVVTPPLNMSACLCGIVSDSGTAKYAFGFNQNSMTLYSPNSGSTIANLVMIGKI